jgi:DNA-binding response OmpR family regulator
MARILLLGLEQTLVDELGRILRQLGQIVRIAPLGSELQKSTDADVVFTSAPLLQTALAARADLPVIVVSRTPEVRDWLDALEEGAADYCGAPFEPLQLRWILNSAIPVRAMPARTFTAA